MCQDKMIKAQSVRSVYEQFSKENCPTDGIGNLQNVFTPYSLCNEMIGKLKKYKKEFKGETFAVFNLEFAEVLMYDYAVDASQIWFFTDCVEKSKFAQLKRYSGIHIELVNFSRFLKEEWNMKFDVVIMNPPYQKPTKGGNGQRDLWPSFVDKAIQLTKKDGQLCAIHPAKWRSPSHVQYLKIMNGLRHLDIHGIKDGKKTFNCSTRYDWYVWQKNTKNKEFTVIDENGSRVKVSKNIPFLPNWNIDEVLSCVATDDEEKLTVLYSASLYEPRKPHMSKEKHGEFKYPCVYGMYKDGSFSCQYSSKKEDFFGVSKIILGIGRHLYPLVDMEGKYAMTQNAFAISVKDTKEARLIVEAINSERFKEIIKATKWGNFQTNYHMFESFRKDFWKKFVDENGNEI